jgi:hypothetical protein
LIPHRYRPLTTGKVSQAATEAAIRFLADLWQYDPRDYTFVGTRRGGRWRDHAIRGNRAEKVAAIIEAHPIDRFDIYFCPNAFSEPHRRTALALPSRCAWCDIDEADPDRYDPQPNILWETSPDRFQGIWLWQEPSPGNVAEQISRNIWAKDGGDKGGWSVTKMLRLPGTINHKSEYQRPVVTLQVYQQRPQALPRSILTAPVVTVEPGSIESKRGDPTKIMRRYRRAMGLQAGTLMTAKRVLRPDRSGAVFSIVAGMIAAGARDFEIVAVLVVNPYFISKWGTDVVAAEDQVARIRTRLDAR